ncbi:MAG TPA: helix-turn-helix transcriptional regulator [Candidatus Tyrphobacter sp.]
MSFPVSLVSPIIDTEGRVHGLTRRESQVFRLALRGYSNKRIGTELGCSENTVRVHLRKVFALFEVAGKLELFAKSFLPAVELLERRGTPGEI